jgi:hypothetical protein
VDVVEGWTSTGSVSDSVRLPGRQGSRRTCGEALNRSHVDHSPCRFAAAAKLHVCSSTFASTFMIHHMNSLPPAMLKLRRHMVLTPWRSRETG